MEDATTGTIVSSVSGTGQVQAGTTINVTPKVSETVTSIPAKVGEHVSAGQLLIQLDPTNEQRALQQAQLALEQAQLSAQEADQVATTTLLQQQDAVTTGEQSVVNASTTLAHDYQSGFNGLGPTFVNLQTVMTGLQRFYERTRHKRESERSGCVCLPSCRNISSRGSLHMRPRCRPNIHIALTAYQQNITDYHAVTASSSPATFDALFAETYNTAQAISNAVKDGKDFFNYIVNNYPAGANGTSVASRDHDHVPNGFLHIYHNDGQRRVGNAEHHIGHRER